MRSFEWAYEPVPDTATPVGNLNTGYVTSTVSDAAKWRRGENPAVTFGPGMPGFALPRPKWMREPGTNAGTHPSIKMADKSYNFAGGQ